MTITDLLALLVPGTKVVITTHKSPDGDAMGSSLALRRMLEKKGLSTQLVVPDGFPGFLNWMDGADQTCVMEYKPWEAKAHIAAADVVFSLDYNHLSRIGDVGTLVAESNAVKVLIDHHLEPSTGFDYVLHDVSASSTAELIYRFFGLMTWTDDIDVPMAECLYAGIMTDTGSFRFSSTGADTHRIAASLMDLGLRPDRIHQLIFDQSSFQRLQLVGYALSEKLEYLESAHVAIISLSQEEKKRFQCAKGDTEGLVNYGLSINGSRVAAFLSEEEGYVKMSLRSKGDVDVNLLARTYFNGGGHKNAAGGRLEGTLSDAIEKVKNALSNAL